VTDEETVAAALALIASRPRRSNCPRCGHGEITTKEGFCRPCLREHNASIEAKRRLADDIKQANREDQ
jgi:hypothetical protein